MDEWPELFDKPHVPLCWLHDYMEGEISRIEVVEGRSDWGKLMVEVNKLPLPRLGPQCCKDHLIAARKGHLECLGRLQERGHFLHLHDPYRSFAGVARKTQAWDAALAACEADHPDVLSWLFHGGWPETIDAKSSQNSSGVAHSKGEAILRGLSITGMPFSGTWSPTELQLFKCAMENVSTKCLESLLVSGCRSILLCPMAARWGREGHLALAAHRGALCDGRTLYHAAARGNLWVLVEAIRYVDLEVKAPSGADVPWSEHGPLQLAFQAAARNGHSLCLGALLSQFGGNACLWESAAIAAALGGQTNCIDRLRRGGWKFCLHHAILAVQGGHADTLMYMLNWDVLGRDADHAGKCFLMKVAAEKEQLECLKRILLWTKSGAIPRECRLRRSARSFCSGCLKLLYGGKN